VIVLLHTADFEDIKSGRVTDLYFQRAVEVLRAEGLDRQVTAEVTSSSFPDGWAWAVLAGIEEAAGLLRELPVDADAMPEGTIIRPGQPVLRLSGMYTDFAVYETPLLGFICQASGIATKAARCKLAAGERTVLSFGARRMHPALAPMVERNAFIGGCDGFAVVEAERLTGVPASGTMPHALILCVGNMADALRLFDRVMDPGVPRIALIDTYGDEKFAALEAAEALGERLYGVRLDTPGSRRGDFRRILEEVRWELDLRGYQQVRLVASGGLDERQILELNAFADAYGVGTAISSAPVVNFAMDIIEVEGTPASKRGKMSGVKDVLRCDECHQDFVVPQGGWPEHECPGELRPLLLPLTRRGELARELPNATAIRGFVLQQVKQMGLTL
jgi:nicotinate phosphoribosyltransferase